MASYFPIPVDLRDTNKLKGSGIYICRDSYGVCSLDHSHPAFYVRVPVLFGELVSGDPTMDSFVIQA